MNRSHYRNASTIPTVSAFNNWFNQHESKTSTISQQSRRMTPAKYSSTIGVNPEKGNNEQGGSKLSSQTRMRRTHSAFKNNQSRVSSMKDDAFDLMHEIKHLAQKTKGSRLELEMTRKQLSEELKQRQTSMRQEVSKLSKLVKQTVKLEELRTEEIKSDSRQLRLQYEQLKQTIYELQGRVAAVEHECGFMTFASKLYK